MADLMLDTLLEQAGNLAGAASVLDTEWLLAQLKRMRSNSADLDEHDMTPTDVDDLVKIVDAVHKLGSVTRDYLARHESTP